MNNDTSDKTQADLDTPAFRQQRITALKRELDEALDILAETATVLTNDGVPYVVDASSIGWTSRLLVEFAPGARGRGHRGPPRFPDEAGS